MMFERVLWRELRIECAIRDPRSAARARQPILFSCRPDRTQDSRHRSARAMRRLADPVRSGSRRAFKTCIRRSVALRSQQNNCSVRSWRGTLHHPERAPVHGAETSFYGWFVGLTPDDAVRFHQESRSTAAWQISREAFFNVVLGLVNWHHFPCQGHFTVDGILLEACASHMSLSRSSPSNRVRIFGLEALQRHPHRRRTLG
jgi:hypothetical protein